MRFVFICLLVSFMILGYGGICQQPDSTTGSSDVAWGPVAPTNLTATAVSSSKINLLWQDNSDDEKEFQIEVSIDGLNYFLLSTISPNVTVFTDTSLVASTIYYYRIRGWNNSGFGHYSNVASATTLPPPNAPSAVALRVVTDSQINVSWIDNSNDENGFRIYRRIGMSGNYMEIFAVAANMVFYSNTGLTPGQDYYYKVVAYNDGGASAYSNEAQAVSTVTLPSVPSGMNVSNISGSSTALSWSDNSDNEDGFIIERSFDGISFSGLVTLTENTTVYTDTGLNSSSPYYYRVSAYNFAGNSANSNHGYVVTPVWTQRLGTLDRDCAFGGASDSEGNIYSTGFTNAGMDGNVYYGGRDVFLVKYDRYGIKQWTKQDGTLQDDYASKVAVDTSGNIYIAGYTYGNFDGNNNAGIIDCFLIKYNSAGIKQWTRMFGTESGDIAEAVYTDSNGNVYVTGLTYGSFPGNTNQGDADVFLAKYDAAGDFKWVSQLGSDLYDTGYAVAVDAGNSIYIAGKTANEFELGQRKGVKGMDDFFIAKYDSNGVKLWAKQDGTNAYDNAYNLALDASGNIYVIGNTNGEMEIGKWQGGYDVFIVKYDSSCTRIWSKQIGSTKNDTAYSLAINNNDYIYIVGDTSDSFGDNAYIGGTDYFLVKYDSSGAQIWVKQGGTMADDNAHDIVITSYNFIYIPVFSFGVIDNYSNQGDYDVFLIKYNLDGQKK
ncbi:MAG: SBBP repeat-containing protein [Candidatus Brocadiia bacterium]